MVGYREVGKQIYEAGSGLAQTIVDRVRPERSELREWYGEIGREKHVEDMYSHIAYLSQAISYNTPSLFLDYVVWFKTLLTGLGIPEKDFVRELQQIRSVLYEELSADQAAATAALIEKALAESQNASRDLPSFLRQDAPLSGLAQEYFQAILSANRRRARLLIADAVKQGISVQDMYLHVFQPCQREIGRLWHLNLVSVAEEHYVTAFTQLIMSELYQYVFQSEPTGPVLVAACVGGELHEMGARMVADFFEMEGWDTHYLGASVPVSGILSHLKKWNASVLAVSAAMLPHVRFVEDIIAAVRNSESTGRVKVLVGGYSFLSAPDLWREIGADGFGRDAAEAVDQAHRLVKDRV